MSYTTTVPAPGSCRVFKTGTTYVAQDYQGKILSTSTTDASIVINAAISGLPGAAARGMGGRVFIHAGDYDCKTQITMDQSLLGYHAVELEGEGKATRLNFVPTGAVTNGILIRMGRPRLAHMSIYGNSFITRLVKAVGVSTTLRSDSGIVEGVEFRGANTTVGLDDLGAPVAGQIGFFREGTDITVGNFYWRFSNLDFRSLDIGLYAQHEMSTSSHYNNINIYGCTEGMRISSGENQIVNVYGTSAGYGRYIIHLENGGGPDVGTNNNLTNITSELYIMGQECATVLIDAGCSNNRLRNVTANVGGPPFDASNHFRVVDRNITPINIDYDVNYTTAPSQSIPAMGWWRPGYQPVGKEEGILAGSMVNDGAIQYFGAYGPSGAPTTAASANAIADFRYNNANANQYVTPLQYPFLTVRFIPATQSSTRIFIGFWNTPASTPGSSSDFLNAKNGIGLWVDSAVSSGQWKVMHNDAAGGSSKTAIAGNPTISNALVMHKCSVYLFQHTVNPFTAPPTPTVKGYVILDGVRTNISTDLPPWDGLVMQTPIIWVETLTTAAAGVRVFDMEFRLDQ